VQLTQSLAQAQQAEKTKETPAPSSTSEPEKLDANAQTQVKLEKLIDAEFVETPLSQVTDHLAEMTGIQFHLDTRPLSDAGITSDVPITLRLKKVPAEMVLRLILRNLDLTYWLDNGVVIVSTRDEANTNLHPLVYRIDDLLYSPSIDKSKEITNFFAKKQKVNYDSLIELIVSTVRPISWDIVGGPGSICPYRGTLVISQTADVHKEVQKLLNDLRQSINKEIEDGDASLSQKQTGMGGSWGGGMMGGMGGTINKKSEDKNKDNAPTTPEKQNKIPAGRGDGGGML
jgi:hypothetical protein